MSEPSRKIDSPGRAAATSDASGERQSGPRAAEPAGAHAETGQYLTFRLRDDEYGVSILQIREILEFSRLTPVPLTPPWIRGVLNLRGSVVPVVDLALKFGLEATRPTDRTCIVIVEVEVEDELSVMGVMVDAVSEVVELDRQALEEPPDFGTRVKVDYLEAMGKIDGRLLLLLDANRVLSTDELLETHVAKTAGDAETESEDGG